MRLLLVEDDELLGDGLRAGLAQAGYAVDWVQDGYAAGHALRSDDFDLLVLDLGLPRRDGLEVLREARAAGVELPVLVLTARDAVEQKVQGLDAGADDYLVKPFELDELLARLRALLRRRAGRSSSEIVHGELVLDPAARAVRLAGQPVSLSTREFNLLLTLLQHRGRVLTRDQLTSGLYGWEGDVESNVLEVFVHNLRRKLGAGLIRTVRGVGYTVDRRQSSQ